MAIKVGINGFGRIGRMVFRAAVQNFPDIEIVGINDLLEPDYLAYMLQFDSVHGRFKGTISVDGTTLIVNGKRIRLRLRKISFSVLVAILFPVFVTISKVPILIFQFIVIEFHPVYVIFVAQGTECEL